MTNVLVYTHCMCIIHVCVSVLLSSRRDFAKREKLARQNGKKTQKRKTMDFLETLKKANESCISVLTMITYLSEQFISY